MQSQSRRLLILFVMGNASALTTIAILDLSAAVMPGPSAIFVVNSAACSKRRAALAAAVGVVLGSGIWALTALLGLATILKAAPILFRVLQAAGGLYLIILGVQSLRTALNHAHEFKIQSGEPSRRLLRQGIQIAVSNPQVILFFGTVFTSSFDQATPAYVRALALPTVMAVDFTWYGLLSVVFTHQGMQHIFNRYAKSVGIAVSAILVLFGCKALLASVAMH